jgi:hypothetical protein
MPKEKNLKGEILLQTRWTKISPRILSITEA